MTRSGVSSVALIIVLGQMILPALGQDLGFSISVDGQHVAGDPVPAHVPRKVDVDLARSDIQIKFDGLDVQPVLNLQSGQRSGRYGAGQPVTLLAASNYPAFVTRSEVVLYEVEKEGLVKQIASFPAALNAPNQWQMPAAGSGEYLALLRVYDANGRYDETRPISLSRSNSLQSDTTDIVKFAEVAGEDNTASRAITVFGGGVTVYGSDVPAGARVHVLNEAVEVDQTQRFATQRILPPGDHNVSVAIAENGGSAMAFDRDINIPSDEWFYVGMADLTIGRRWGSGSIVAANPNEFDGVYAKGRTAFYLKGKIKGEYLLTASGDTGEGPLDQMFTGVLSKDPQEVLRRIDPEEFYPVYGDDSTMVDDAPTKGKFYVRLERGPSHVMWGNFRTQLGASAFVQGDKAAYGASGVYKSDQVTSSGDARLAASVYAAHPGGRSERDVMRGTGGTAYFLRRQDVVRGSETIAVETRNATTGLVVSRRPLTVNVDYQINYMQGVVLLTSPLRSGAGASGLASPTGSAEIVELVVDYDYVPVDASLDDYSVGGRAEAWLNDHVRVGTTGVAEKNDDADVVVLGADVRLQKTVNSYFAAEVMQTDGSGASNWLSTDGGLTYVQQSKAGGAKHAATGFRLNAMADLADFSETLRGRIGATVEGREAGFWSKGAQAQADQLLVSTFANLELDEQTRLKGQYDQYVDSASKRRGEMSVELARQLDPYWEIAVAVGYLDRFAPNSGAGKNGQRLDLGARLTFSVNEDLALYGFGRGTAWHSQGFPRNDRGGVGLEWKLNDDWSVAGEVSAGTTGPGAMAMLDFHPDANHRSYLGYRLNPDYDQEFASILNGEKSGFVIGTEHRYSEALSVYAENNSSYFDAQRSITNTYGLRFTPDKHWRFDGSVEYARIEDPNASDFDRQAISLGGAFTDDGVKASARGEVRREDSEDNTRDRLSYLLRTGVNWNVVPDWTLQARFDAAISNSSAGLLKDGDFVKADIGFAYRPVEHDQLNLLMRYTFLYVLPGSDKVTARTVLPNPAQRSHVFSIDANYDITPQITIGGKYGVRIGEVSLTRKAEDFTVSTAHLGIVRVDLEVIKDVDLLLEARALAMPEAQTIDYGALTAAYYNINDNVKVGLGYNWGKFSDDLTDQVFDDRGVFFNVLGKF